MYRRYIFENETFTVGLFHEDDDSCYRFAYQANRIAVVDIPLYYYFKSTTGLMSKRTAEDFEIIKSIYEKRITFFKHRNEEVLVDGSYCRFAIVAILYYAEAVAKKYDLSYRNAAFDCVRSCLTHISKSKYCSQKDKTIIKGFVLAPKLITAIIQLLYH